MKISWPQLIIALTGLGLAGIALLAGQIGLDRNPGWGLGRIGLLSIGVLLLGWSAASRYCSRIQAGFRLLKESQALRSITSVFLRRLPTSTYPIELLLLFLIALIASGYFYTQDDANSASRLAMLKAVVEENRFSIDSYVQGAFTTPDKSIYNGHYYSDKAIGAALIGIEFYSPIHAINDSFASVVRLGEFKLLIKFLAISLPCAFLAPLLYAFVKSVSDSRWRALLVALGICLGTPFYVYSAAYYGHSLAAAFLFVGFYLWFQMNKEGRLAPVKVWCSGCLLAYAVITEYPTALIAIVICGYILHSLWQHGCLSDPKPYLYMALGAAIPLAALVLYNYSIFGTPIAMGYMHEADPGFYASQSAGLMGIGAPNLKNLFYMTFHTTEGIFWQSPILLLAFPGWIAMWQIRQHRIPATFAFCLVLAYLVLFSGYYAWWGHRSFTPRHLIPATVFFAIPLAFVPRKASLVMVALAVISIAQMFIVIATRDHGLVTITTGFEQGVSYGLFENSTIYHIYLPNFISGLLAPNFGHTYLKLPNAHYRSLVPLFSAQLILLAVFACLPVLQRRTDISLGAPSAGPH